MFQTAEGEYTKGQDKVKEHTTTNLRFVSSSHVPLPHLVQHALACSNQNTGMFQTAPAASAAAPPPGR